MSALRIASSLNSLLTLFSTPGSSRTGNTADYLAGLTDGNDFGSLLALCQAGLPAQAISQLIDSQAPTSKTTQSTLSSDGRNHSLFDPESAYRMMTEINRRDVNYKAQYAELSQMKENVSALQADSQNLSDDVDASSNSTAIRNELQDFTTRYNAWIERFQSSIDAGQILDDVQAAEISLYELEQSVENRFNGAALGINGLKDIGITVDPDTHLISLDTTKLDLSIQTNQQAVVGAIDQFAANFSRASALLVSDGNFIDNRLDNLDRAIDFIATNEQSLQAEFGLGDPAAPSPRVAKALSAYNQIHTS